VAVLSVLPAFFFTGVVTAEKKEEEKKPQTLCPVMGGKINKNVYKDYQGQRIYFCCKGCPIKFEKDPEEYMKKIEKDNVLLESVQKTCPVMGNKINKKFYKDYKGRRVYFCCPKCIKTFDKEPEKYLKTLDEEPKKEEEKEAGHKKDDH